jgi:hypothetical protein
MKFAKLQDVHLQTPKPNMVLETENPLLASLEIKQDDSQSVQLRMKTSLKGS